MVDLQSQDESEGDRRLNQSLLAKGMLPPKAAPNLFGPQFKKRDSSFSALDSSSVALLGGAPDNLFGAGPYRDSERVRGSSWRMRSSQMIGQRQTSTVSAGFQSNHSAATTGFQSRPADTTRIEHYLLRNAPEEEVAG